MKFEINLSIDWTIQLNEENGVGNGTVPVREEIEFDQRYAEEKKNTMAGCGHKLQKRNGKEAERCSGPKGRGRIVQDPTSDQLVVRLRAPAERAVNADKVCRRRVPDHL